MDDPSAKDARRPGSGPRPAPVSRALPMLLLRAREAVLEPARPILRRHDLTEPQWRVLRTLDVDGEMETTRLSQAASLHAPSVTRIMRDLSAKGYVARKAGPRDGRVVMVAITPAGHAVVAEVWPQVLQLAARLRAAYGEAAMQELEKRLARLIETAESRD